MSVIHPPSLQKYIYKSSIKAYVLSLSLSLQFHNPKRKKEKLIIIKNKEKREKKYKTYKLKHNAVSSQLLSDQLGLKSPVRSPHS